MLVVAVLLKLICFVVKRRLCARIVFNFIRSPNKHTLLISSSTNAVECVTACSTTKETSEKLSEHTHTCEESGVYALSVHLSFVACDILFCSPFLVVFACFWFYVCAIFPFAFNWRSMLCANNLPFFYCWRWTIYFAWHSRFSAEWIIVVPVHSNFYALRKWIYGIWNSLSFKHSKCYADELCRAVALDMTEGGGGKKGVYWQFI